jgi:hypothetical protein
MIYGSGKIDYSDRNQNIFRGKYGKAIRVFKFFLMILAEWVNGYRPDDGGQ